MLCMLPHSTQWHLSTSMHAPPIPYGPSVRPCRILHKLGRAETNGMLSETEKAQADATSWEDLIAGFRARNNSFRGNCFSSGSSAYRGVSFQKHRSIWTVRIRTSGKLVNLGSYSNEELAALAYDCAAYHVLGRCASVAVWECIQF